QIITNVLSNAIKFTEQGEVRLSMRIEPDGHLTIEISDTGTGMSEDQLNRVFDWFTQADSSTARKFGGTGLGMSIVQRFVDAMSGKIRIDSALGKGTRVSITFPFPRADAALKTTEADDETFSLPEGFRVLIVDDIETNLMVIELIVRNFGAETAVANSGRQAIELSVSEEFNLVLMDIAMPDIDGVAALKEIRRLRHERNLPPVTVFAVTANAMEHQVVSYLEAGFDDYVAKPVNAKLLGKLLRQRFAEQISNEQTSNEQTRSRAG
ncbi:MAG: ATP-binding protein, partial [Pseudomonadota bacterium]